MRVNQATQWTCSRQHATRFGATHGDGDGHDGKQVDVEILKIAHVDTYPVHDENRGVLNHAVQRHVLENVEGGD